jgi:hypothetical protein
MKVPDADRRHAVMQAARSKWGNPRLALVEHVDGTWDIREYAIGTGVVVESSADHWVVRETSKVLWAGASLQDAAKAVGL